MVCSKSRSKVATVLGVRARQVSAKAAKRSLDRKSTRLNSSHGYISYAVFCLKKKKNPTASPASSHDTVGSGGHCHPGVEDTCLRPIKPRIIPRLARAVRAGLVLRRPLADPCR